MDEKKLFELDYTQLKNALNPKDFNFKTTAELTENENIIGQNRAVSSFSLALSVKSRGYNIYASGMAGTGKTSFSKQFASKHAKSEPTPPDLCYIYNFKDPKYPKALKLIAGVGKALKKDMEELVDVLSDELPKVFAAKDFEAQKSEIVKAYQSKRDDIIKAMTEEAKEQSFGVKTTNSGIYFMPIVNEVVISEEQFDELPQDEKDQISEASEKIQSKAEEAMRGIKEFEKETRKEVESLEYSIGLFTVGRHFSVMFEKYSDNDEVLAYLGDVKEDILDNLADFLEEETEEDEAMQSLLPWIAKKSPDESFTKYSVNLLVDNSGQFGAPVLIDYNPTYTNLIGETEFDNEYGNLTTDFMKIKPGLFHKANGGYLILQAHDVFANIHSWETIRRVLLTSEIVIEPLREFSGGFAVSGIKPEPFTTNVKVILVGTSYYYDVLFEYDDEFRKLFKIFAEFDYEMDNSKENLAEMARFVKKIIVKENLLEFDCASVIAICEFSGRIAENQKKLTAALSQIEEIIIEANAWALSNSKKIVTKEYVKKAIFEREGRSKLYEDKLTEMFDSNYILIDTKGEKIGQVNALAVIDVGEYSFAKPAKVSATTYMGKAGIVNIEQESDLSGPIHDKGVQVLIGYLGQTYAQNFPISLSCRVCFEQNYGGIDGDSASSTELYAILSSIAEIPIKQNFAVTGSMNQRGEIQPIGGVTYKVEGFFDLCNSRGLTGDQGVIIPKQNVQDLMLRDDVISAVKSGTFHVFAVSHVDEALEILTGTQIHAKVQKRLKSFYKRSQE